MEEELGKLQAIYEEGYIDGWNEGYETRKTEEELAVRVQLDWIEGDKDNV